MLYEVENLSDAREFLTRCEQKIILSNPQGSTRYYGMRVIDYIFKTLQREFPTKISDFVVDAYDDHSAFITAKQLGYKNIKYLGEE